jgi:signal transduction histidine kinase
VPAERTDVTACLVAVEALARLLEPALAVHVRIGPGVPAAACDPDDLKAALMHLIFNARDALAGDGLVSIRAMRVLDHGAPAVGIEVTDNGIGMAPHTVVRAFDPCFTTKCEGLGGAGLPMVERFVREAGGSVAIESTPGLGTKVALRLPGANAPREFHREESGR